MEEEKLTEEKPAGVIHKSLSAIGLVISILVTPLLILNCVLIIKMYLHPDDIPRIGGWIPFVVMTDSMSPVIQAGDLILCHTLLPEEVSEDDVIAFIDPAGSGKTLVTHRVTQVNVDKNGAMYWNTKGDANDAEDAKAVPEEKLVGKYRKRIPKLGHVILFVQSRTGVIVCVFCPILLILLWDLYRKKREDRENKQLVRKLQEELAQVKSGGVRESECQAKTDNSKIAI